jgi:hypothetical protein
LIPDTTSLQYALPETNSDLPEACGYTIHSCCWSLLTQVLPNDSSTFSSLLDICLCLPGYRHTVASRLDWGHAYGLHPYLDHPFSLIRGENRKLTDGTFRLFRHGKSNPYVIPEVERILLELKANKINPERELTDSIYEKRSELSLVESLPVEVLFLILQMLPSKDVLHFKLASPIIASLPLTESFWASRFFCGHEFDHIFEAKRGSGNQLAGNWENLYFSLVEIEIVNSHLLNRRRIWDLLLSIRDAMPDKEERILHGQNLNEGKPRRQKFYVDESKDVKFGKRHDMSWGKTFLRTRKVSLNNPISAISVSFVKWNNNDYISGFNFIENTGGEARLGYIRKMNTRTIYAEEIEEGKSSFRLSHCVVAMDSFGIRAICFVTSRGLTSPWLGNHEEIPQQRIMAKGIRTSEWIGRFDVCIPCPFGTLGLIW